MRKLIAVVFIICIIYLAKETSDALLRIEESIKTIPNVIPDCDAERNFREYQRERGDLREEEDYWEEEFDEDFYRRKSSYIICDFKPNNLS